METDDLRYFVAAYEAAGLMESLPQAQGAPQGLRLDASKRVRRLEAMLGSPLFRERNGRRVPTRAAEELYAHAKQVLGAAPSTGQTTIPAP
jgi:DNA-binding transcriptional LysR family regulator